jgi:predicted metal-dependent peptidase
MPHSDKVLKTRARLLLKSAFFGTLLVSAPMIRVPGLGTAATDMVSIAYDPDWFDSLPLDEIVGVLAHEVLHIALKHGLRRQGRDPVVWNMACDYAVNLILIDCGFKLPEGGLVDKTYKDMAAEQIYALLEKKQPKRPQRPGSGKGSGSGAPNTQGDGIPGTGSDLLAPGSLGKDGKPDPAAEAAAHDPAKLREIERRLTERIAQATNMGRMAGNMPGSLLRALDNLLHPPVPWQELLRPMMRSVVKANESWSRRNRRFSQVYLPSRHSTQIRKVVVIGDTSGSITSDDLRSIGGSIVDIAEEVNPRSIHVLWADTRVAGEQVFESGDTIRLEPKGGGGTDMRVPLAYAAELNPDVVVLITDGETPWPGSAPDYPLITVCTTKVAVPFGEVVRI